MLFYLFVQNEPQFCWFLMIFLHINALFYFISLLLSFCLCLNKSLDSWLSLHDGNNHLKTSSTYIGVECALWGKSSTSCIERSTSCFEGCTSCSDDITLRPGAAYNSQSVGKLSPQVATFRHGHGGATSCPEGGTSCLGDGKLYQEGGKLYLEACRNIAG